MMVILKEIFEKVDFEKKSAGHKKHAKLPSRQKVKTVSTVNSEIFARVLFSRNFADAEFRENKTFAKWRKHFVPYKCR